MISNPSGRLAVYGTPGGVWDAWRCMGRLAGGGIFRAQKKVVES